MHRSALARFLFLLLPAAAFAQSLEWSANLANDYAITPNITYLTANNYAAKLDVYKPRAANAQAPVPTLIYIHGGGWVGGTKETSFFTTMPYLQMGWAVVNVEYRLAAVSLGPAAVEDCLCALKWVVRNAKQYGFDVNKLVVTGHSAGGHLSLTTGMLGATDLHRQCPGDEPKVAAIVNWYGITDVVDLLDGPNQRSYAVAWLGSLPNRNEIAKRVSPLEYVRAGQPPVITIHGDADPVVPYQHAVRLHAALEKARVPNKLVTIPRGGHGGFPTPENVRAFTAIREFLAAQGLK